MNLQKRSCIISTRFKHDIVNNYFVYGPKGKNPWFQVDKNQSIYASGNMIDNNRDGTLNGSPTSIYYYQGAGEELTEPWSEETKKNPVYSAATAWRLVNSQSGVLPYDDIDSLIWHQAGTLGKEGALAKSVADMGLSANGGWGEVLAGEAPVDSDGDGMPDYFEEAMGYDKSKDDATSKAADGYLFIEKYINWLGAMHTRAKQDSSTVFDLRTITRAFQDVSPVYAVEAPDGGSVSLKEDGYSAEFTPAKNFHGLTAFRYTVKGNDGTEYTGRVEVLVEKSKAAEDSVSEETTALSAENKYPHFDARVLDGTLRLAGIPEGAKISIYSLGGKKLFESKVGLSAKGSATVPVKSFDRGIYMVNVRGPANGISFHRTFKISR